MKDFSFDCFINQFGQKGFSWRTLNRFLDSKFFQNLYIWIFVLPIVSKIFESIPHKLSMKPFSTNEAIVLNLQLPFSWYLLYISGLLLLISRTVYAIFCPYFIRSYENAGDAIQKGVTIQFIGNAARDFLKRYYRKKYSPNSEERSNLFDLLNQYRVDTTKIDIRLSAGVEIGGELVDLLESIVIKEYPNDSRYYTIDGGHPSLIIEKEQLIKHCFWDLYDLQNTSHPLTRTLCSLLAVLGFALFGLTIVSSMFYVLGRYISP